MDLAKEKATETEPERGMELVGWRGKQMEEGTCL